MTTLPPIWLDHINLPARDPERLCAWYATKLGLKAGANIAHAPGITIAFSLGDPLPQGNKLHFGLRAESRSAVEAWAQHFSTGIDFDEADFFATRIRDPEGNLFEIYWDKT
jgi:catechol 2,3-dioxygenase-like lactoylglutathione lyase family enzyme